MVIPSDSAAPRSRRVTSPKPKRKVLVVDDHPVFRFGLAQLIAREDDLEVCAEAASAGAALEAMRTHNPDIAIVDVSLQGANGIDLLKRMKSEKPRLHVLMISLHEETLYPLRSLRAGASGYVTKRAGVNEIITAVRHVLGGQIYLGAELAQRLILKSLGSGGSGAGSPVDPLSDRELEVLQLLGRGLGTRDIAERLNLSVKTIESHRANIKIKLGCKDGSEMVRFAMDWTAQQRLAGGGAD
jgi:DNA-binding NarL/FixJ family response regulator